MECLAIAYYSVFYSVDNIYEKCGWIFLNFAELGPDLRNILR